MRPIPQFAGCRGLSAERRPRENEEHQPQFQEQALERSKGEAHQTVRACQTAQVLSLVPVEGRKRSAGTDAAVQDNVRQDPQDPRIGAFFMTIPSGKSLRRGTVSPVRFTAASC